MSKAKNVILRSKNLILYKKYIPAEYIPVQESKIIYIPIPKVACTAIKMSLFGYGHTYSIDKEDYMNIHGSLNSKIIYKLSMKYVSYFKFAFVRNPYERLISCYNDKVIKEKQHNGRYFFDTGYNNILIRGLFGDSFNSDMSFDNFIKLVVKIPDFLSDGHFMSQCGFLCEGENLIPDFIGRFESLDEDWEILSRRYNLNPLEMRNKTKESKVEDYYTKSLKKLVYKRYKKDFKLLGYNE